MGIDRKTREDILGIKKEVYNRTGVNNTRFRQKKMRVKVDASDYTTREVLFMKYEDR